MLTENKDNRMIFVNVKLEKRFYVEGHRNGYLVEPVEPHPVGKLFVDEYEFKERFVDIDRWERRLEREKARANKVHAEPKVRRKPKRIRRDYTKNLDKDKYCDYVVEGMEKAFFNGCFDPAIPRSQVFEKDPLPNCFKKMRGAT